MNTAEALAQIKACMAAPTEPVACVLLRADGSYHEIITDQRKMGELLGGRPTFVGAIASLGVQAVACEGAKKRSKHSFPESFESGIKGDVLLFRIDEDAAPLPFTPTEYKDWVAAGGPDDVPDEDEEDEEVDDAEISEEGGEDASEDADDDDEDESEEEEEEEEESEDEEPEDFESFAEKMKELPLKELKLACQSLQVSDKGTKNELIARLHEAAQAATGSGSDQDDDDESDNSDVDEEEQPVHPQPEVVASIEKGKGKARASPGPVKTIAKGRKLRA